MAALCSFWIAIGAFFSTSIVCGSTSLVSVSDLCIDKADEDGSEYRGTVSVTASGHVCQRWDSQSPNKHKAMTSENYPDAGLQENYCRNPDGDSGPWCYNAEGTKPRFEFCEIPKCVSDSKMVIEDLGCWKDT
ncbi:plasminogen-like [Bolinopsis microptera]|uniref:plasminogen-like n=1 Tax=Bolinopsis microptera TaxID=2820187 RepID=UPI00307AF600